MQATPSALPPLLQLLTDTLDQAATGQAAANAEVCHCVVTQ